MLDINGEVTKPIKLRMSDLIEMDKDTASLKDRSGAKHLFGGVVIAELLQKAGVTLNSDLRGENLSKYLLVKASDGYEVLFSLAEIDNNFTERKIILAYEMDGKPLPSEKGSLRLIVPDEKIPARSCYEVVTFYIGWAKERP
ncbi:molybdopterin-dependent oxidoreductase [Olivibacter sp. CPCC 100613]